MAKELKYTDKHLRESQERAFLQTLPEIQEKFLNDFDANPIQFLMKLSKTLRIPSASIPVLHLICPIQFVDTWMRVPGEWRDYIGSALNDRDQTSFRENRFPEEQAWARKVVSEIERRAEGYGLQPYRIRRLFLPKIRFVGKYSGSDAKRKTEPE